MVVYDGDRRIESDAYRALPFKDAEF